jgi:hypothetical protein
MAERFADFLDQTLAAIALERPGIARRLVATLRQHPVGLDVDGEVTGVHVEGSTLAVGRVPSPAVRVTTTNPAVLALVDGDTDLAGAIQTDRLDLQGRVEDVAVFERALAIYLHGAARIRAVRRLLDVYRRTVTSPNVRPSKENAMSDPREPKTPKFPQEGRRKSVTIFGAGVTGLTVAHELMERGFHVQVWEKRRDDRQPDRGCEIGGMARSQWGTVPRPEVFEGSDGEEVPPVESGKSKTFWKARETPQVTTLPYRFLLRMNGSATPHIAAEGIVDGKYNNDFETVFKALIHSCHQRHETTPVVYAEAIYRQDYYDQLQAGPPSSDPATVFVQAAQHACHAKKNPFDVGGGLVLEIGDHNDVFTITGGGKKVRGTVIRRDLPLDDASAWLGGDPTVVGVISFRVREYQIPGEHGYRFFPSFYWHLFDTLKRIPILQAVPKSPLAAAQERTVHFDEPDPSNLEATGRTVYDNLMTASNQAVAYADGFRPSVFPRYQPESFEDMLDFLGTVLRHRKQPAWSRLPGEKPEPPDERTGMGLTPRDVIRFQLKLAQFMGSCEQRRRRYERMSWWDFLGTDTFSPDFQNGQNEWPEALVAMKALDVDARTQGNAVCQLLIDEIRPRGYRDGVLNGPTTVSWFEHWKRYLEAQGVEFIHGELTGFAWVDFWEKDADGNEKKVGPRLMPRARVLDPRHPVKDNDPDMPYLMDGYYVVAVPVADGQRLLQESLDEGTTKELAERAEFRDLNRLRAMNLGTWTTDQGERRLSELDDAKNEETPLRNFHGIQFYFDEPLNWLDGHMFFAQAPWGLSSISQTRYWQDRQDWEHGYRGVLSVIIGVWDRPSRENGPTAWQSPPEQLAAEVWKQIVDNVSVERRKYVPQHDFGGPPPDDQPLPIPAPKAWRLNEDLEWLPGLKHYRNKSPFLISRPGEWASRPGELPIEDERSGQVQENYQVCDGIVLAGTFMKTYTRLTSMEAANESARHAVNAILQDARLKSVQSRADTWPMEQREIEDLKWLKDLDDAYLRRGLDHPLEDPNLQRLIVESLPGVMKKRAARTKRPPSVGPEEHQEKHGKQDKQKGDKHADQG